MYTNKIKALLKDQRYRRVEKIEAGYLVSNNYAIWMAEEGSPLLDSKLFTVLPTKTGQQFFGHGLESTAGLLSQFWCGLKTDGPAEITPLILNDGGYKRLAIILKSGELAWVDTGHLDTLTTHYPSLSIYGDKPDAPLLVTHQDKKGLYLMALMPCLMRTNSPTYRKVLPVLEMLMSQAEQAEAAD